MAALKRFSLRALGRLDQKGSALLVTLMVMVGLSLIGLAFVALSETESAISVNERNSAQTLHVAEAGGLLVVEWFQNPRWARDQNFMPANVDAIKVLRRVTQPDGTLVYEGRYKPAATQLLADRPFKPQFEHRFLGTENNPDILINDRTAPQFLAEFNIALFNRDTTAAAAANCSGCDNTEGGRVTEIRIYAPPIDGGFVNAAPGWADPATSGIPAASGFHFGGTRFGLATIRVTATKYNTPACGPYVAGCRQIAQRSVKLVVGEWPFPGPQGPIQSNANIATTGNYHIHWGQITSTLDTDLKRPYVSLPWHNSYDRVAFERGYEAAGAITETNEARQWVTDTTSAVVPVRHDWLYELIGRTFEDPWYQARARGHIEQMKSTTDPHEFRYTNPALDPSGPACNPCNAGKGASPGQSNMFQRQTKAERDDYRNALFPRIDYDFWKQVAISGDSQDNVYYLRHVTKDEFADRNGNQRTFRQWVDVMSNPPAGTGPKSQPGFYFFDTANGLNPQNNRGGVLTPKVSMSGGKMQMKGFIYINTASFDVTGLDGYAGYYNMPGEAYQDIGFREVDEVTRLWAKRDAAGLPCTAADTSNCRNNSYLANNNRWDYQDLPWSNGGMTKNEKFDVYIAKRNGSLARSSGGNLINEYFVRVWTPGCIPGDNDFAGANCSEPHEPYLNYIYPTTATGSIQVRWELPGSETRRRKTTTVSPPTALPACTSTSTQEECTSNAYDRDGGLVEIAPILDGVLYAEGEFGSAGNAHYFGSLMFEKDVDASGTPNIWFDEKLIKGDWPPGNFGFPRVYITTFETDQ
ncbi:MAG TPA: pilus assembly PilX N-terminal domain-containing protein [Thermoanaerobaculia bacterium]|jgi:hypothetical protein